jgi:hypothetical protein
MSTELCTSRASCTLVLPQLTEHDGTVAAVLAGHNISRSNCVFVCTVVVIKRVVAPAVVPCRMELLSTTVVLTELGVTSCSTIVVLVCCVIGIGVLRKHKGICSPGRCHHDHCAEAPLGQAASWCCLSSMTLMALCRLCLRGVLLAVATVLFFAMSL